jgi:Flp pilus assembly protein TadG
LGTQRWFPAETYDYSQGVTTEFKATIKKAGTYTVKFVFYDIDGQKRLNGEDETATITVTDLAVTSLTMSAANVDATTDEQFTMAVTAQGTVADADKEHKVRFYGVIPGLSASDIEFATIPGGTPEIVTDATERGYAGASEGDLVLAWGPKGGFPLKPMTIAKE